jgi:NAD-dependent dihydropyrimidine dehydrogenase PreA subunit
MDKLSYRMLYIGSGPAGLLGLEELFTELYDKGAMPGTTEIGDMLIAGVEEHNFIAKPSVEDYRAVLKREYAQYFNGRATGKPTVAKKYGTWQGHPRETIPWFPTISSELCNGCNACLELCAHGVYDKGEDGKVIVVDPFSCIVGCCFCKSVCDPKAIVFPSQELLTNYRPKA